MGAVRRFAQQGVILARIAGQLLQVRAQAFQQGGVAGVVLDFLRGHVMFFFPYQSRSFSRWLELWSDAACSRRASSSSAHTSSSVACGNSWYHSPTARNGSGVSA